ncbi:hypothetical protein SELMODRAFT_89928 [Selaginella moellendorffii]|uniref:Uncharacterized protein n=1 Tax=Selaginella moellendorffii TaxID=88036 RepID=D8RAT0_SELML|nr:hypothetical protein SELMODRAFT_89928 [Selaginella moellendorffii]
MDHPRKNFTPAAAFAAFGFACVSLGLYVALLPPEYLDRGSLPAGLWARAPDLSSAEILLRRVAENGTQGCHNVSTAAAVLFGIPRAEDGGEITLAADEVHKFWIVSYAADGSRRCSGGDFYETDISAGPTWKSRPPVTDLGDGAYLVELKVNGDFARSYNFTVSLVYTNFHGLDHVPNKWAFKKEMFRLLINFTAGSRRRKHQLHTCAASDLRSTTSPPSQWQGRWSRTKFNSSCQLDKNGRYLCLDPAEQCDESQCSGAINSLESNGWVYSAHCKFRIWNSAEAWQCLDGKKLFFWGDSNHQDTVRNLLNFVLGHQLKFVDRIFVANFTNPANPSQVVRLASIFNGHPDPHHNFLGLGSLYVPQYRDFVQSVVRQGGMPDAVILNSGIHDGMNWKTMAEFLEAARNASVFWKDLLGDESKARVVFRSTVATGLGFRDLGSNPHKMEAFNSILGEELAKELGGLEHFMFVDDYDITFPWHYDFCCSDGAHFGQPPALKNWFDRIGHFYFVDLMLVHILLTAICS